MYSADRTRTSLALPSTSIRTRSSVVGRVAGDGLAFYVPSSYGEYESVLSSTPTSDLPIYPDCDSRACTILRMWYSAAVTAVVDEHGTVMCWVALESVDFSGGGNMIHLWRAPCYSPLSFFRLLRRQMRGILSHVGVLYADIPDHRLSTLRLARILGFAKIEDTDHGSQLWRKSAGPSALRAADHG